ncbi:hypothetical protein, partial [Mycobacterium sp.]|uniref:hypothetical protein n=1 Tax=Mycobacterium sp. TaxID=1785 RepID=UPI003F9E616D
WREPGLPLLVVDWRCRAFIYQRYSASARPQMHGEQFHVSMFHVPFGPWQLARANSQRDV